MEENPINRIKKSFLAWLVVAILSAALSISSLSATDTPRFLSENFSDIGTLSTSDWFMINKSTPVGSRDWFQGDFNTFASLNGDNSYIAANFRNTIDENTISNFLLTPELTISNGSVLTFYTRCIDRMWPDRLLVRMSTSGGSTNVGDGITDFGDFSTVLLSINPDLNVTDYPKTWTQYSVTIEGLESEVTGRFAFHYDFENGGPAGDKSDYIGIDTVSYTQKFIVQTQAIPEAGGTVTGDGSYLFGSEITIQATSNPGYQFVNWTDTQGAIVSSDDSYEWTVDNPLDITANFELIMGTLVLSITPSEALSLGASFSLDGGLTWMTSDRINLVPGEYSVTFKDVSGWVTPNSISRVIITADTDTSIMVNYLPEVTTTPTPEPTVAPTPFPTIVPSVTPTLVPAVAPTAAPTASPTVVVSSTTQANKSASGTSTGADTSAKTMDQTDSTEAPTPTATPTSAPTPTQVTEPSETAPSADQQQDKSSSTSTPSDSKTEASSNASKIWSTIGLISAAVFAIGLVLLVIIIVKKKKGRR